MNKVLLSNKFTSGQVNKLLVDRVNKRQSNRWTYLKLTSELTSWRVNKFLISNEFTNKIEIMIICPIRLIWLMGLNHFITLHHLSSPFIILSSQFINTHHPTPTHELPRNRRISIQQHTRLRTRRGICLQRRTRDNKGFGRAFWSSTYPLPFYSCCRNQRKRFMLPHVGSYPPSWRI